MHANDPMVWIGLSTSGPDPERDRITAIRVVITDRELVVLADGGAVEVGDDATEAQTKATELLAQHVAKGAGRLAGARVHWVRGFLARQMPEILEHLHYRNIDVSTVRELVRRWYPDVYGERPRGADDALLGEVAELGHYRARAFVEAGPTDAPPSSG